MKKFAKSILNYFATYTETRFNFQKKIDYKWTDNSLTSDFSVFPDFQKKILDSVKKGEKFNFEVKRGDYKVSLNEDEFKQKLIDKLESDYNLEYLKSCIKQSKDRLLQLYGNKTILSGEEGNRVVDNIEQKEEFQKQIFSEGSRKYNLAFRNAAKEILYKLQKQKIEQLKTELKFKSKPLSTLNPQSIEQEIFDSLQKLAQKENNEEKYFSQIKKQILDKSFDLTIFDLYGTIRKFIPFVGIGNAYIFFHELYLEKEEETEKIDKYPLFLIEVEVDELADKLIIRSKHDIVIINAPAINSFEFENILTTPRAARFIDAKYYLGSIENHLQNTYNIFDEFLLVHCFKSFQLPNYPNISFRIGLQVVQKENRKLLDYSELITHLDAGKGDKFLGLIKNYISGNVKNTTDKVDEEFNKHYPRKSVNNLLSTIPLSLNNPQKRILIALENERNNIIVVDGPPGTGKSYAIAAITYWANQKNKSIVVTSHKKAALDVIDRMMTDKFRALHPESKPSILRISRDDISINNFENTLSDPVISASNKRVNQFNEEAVEKDLTNWHQIIEEQNNNFWANSENYQEYISKLLNLEQIEKELQEKSIIKENQSSHKLQKDENINFELIRDFVKKIKENNLNNFSLEQLVFLYQKSNSINDWLTACQNINNLSIEKTEVDNLKNYDFKNLDQFSDLFFKIAENLKSESLIFTDKEKLKYRSMLIKMKIKNNQEFHNNLNSLEKLEYDHVLTNIFYLKSKEKSTITVKELKSGISKLKDIRNYIKNRELLTPVLQSLNLTEEDIKQLFHLLSKIKGLINNLNSNTLSSLQILKKYFSPILSEVDIYFDDLQSLNELFLEKDIPNKVLNYIRLFIELNQKEVFNLPDQEVIKEYYQTLHKKLENINDQRTKNLNNFSTEKERIIVSMKAGKRLTPKELEVLSENISCIIAEPDLISKYFPMKEDSIELLVIDEASQVSIAESISLLLRAKQVVVFGDEYQYGAVGAYNVSKRYSDQYFKEILDNYAKDYQIAFDEKEKEKITAEASLDVNPDDQFIEAIYKPEEGTKEWLKTFSIRTSTLNFAKALKNYSTSLDIHFRSFPEIIEYSNEYFYRPSQIPLIVNRIRTKPIDEVLRFIKVDTKGNSGNNVNLDEVIAIKEDIQNLIANGFKGTIGIITSFREQKYRMEEILRKELPNYHRLSKKHKLVIWFVGDVQGEERDIVYYSLVEDKKIGNADLRTIYPVVGGKADSIRSLKMQRLNVGFSRAKDTMVIVHSMSLKEYSNTRMGDALKFYQEIQKSAIDNYIADETIFGSPTEKDLYNLLIQTDFYKINRNKIKIIAQFPIGEYIQKTYNKYIPKYRVDFLIIFSHHGKEKSLILEYDGVEYHTKNPEIVTKHNFSQEYLEYDIQRQLELESYGYGFLRINKFILLPQEKNQTKLDILNNLLVKKLSFKEN